jgi:outer membrane protein assembly factor BamA
MRLLFAVLLAGACLPGQQPSYPIQRLALEGNSRLRTEPVLAASGLRVGQTATPADFAKACDRLMETGLFRSARYRYEPAAATEPAFAVTLQVAEAEELQPVRIEIPEVQEEDLWSWMAQNEPLVTRQAPANPAAERYYAAAIERYLDSCNKRERIIATGRVDAAAGMLTVFRPAELPKIAELRFEGNRSVPAAALVTAFSGPALGSEYSEQLVRELLELNVRPIYEELGRLRVAFPVIAAEKVAGGIAVTVSVSEGDVYQLGDIQVACDGIAQAELLKAAALKPGEVANWKKITEALGRMQSVLGRHGYLQPSEQVDRSFDEVAHRVGLIVSLQKGPQSLFGELRIRGLAPDAEARARKLWKLEAGAPMNIDYVEEYLKQVAADGRVRRGGFTTIGRRLEPRAAGGLIDVTIEFE